MTALTSNTLPGCEMPHLPNMAFNRTDLGLASPSSAAGQLDR
jgi:hypothetical protein